MLPYLDTLSKLVDHKLVSKSDYYYYYYYYDNQKLDDKVMKNVNDNGNKDSDESVR